MTSGTSGSPGWRYTPVRRTGTGATGAVWEALRDDGLRVALKVGGSAATRGRLADEAERLLFVDSPYVVRVLDAGRVPPGVEALARGAPFLALEWLEGVPGDHAPFEPMHAASVVARDVGAALADLHAAGSAHGDVKPSNVYFEASGERARLLDLGLGSPASARRPEGGTPRYLAPDAFSPEGGDARAHDLWALGLTLLDLASGTARSGSRVDPDAARRSASALPGTLAHVVRALLSATPGLRPSAEWVATQARHALGEATERSPRDARAAVGRAYLAARREEVLRAARHATFSVLATGVPGTWLREAVSIAAAVAALRGTPMDRPAPPLGTLDAFGQRKWLVHLVGAVAASWRVPPLSDADLAERLLHLAEGLPPAAFTLAALTGEAVSNRPLEKTSPVDVALALGARPLRAEALTAAERLLERSLGTPALGLATARALRLRGESGRAMAVLGRLESPLAAAERAETARRGGDSVGALAIARGAASSPADPVATARIRALQARIALEEQRPNDAATLLDGAPQTSASLECLCLVQLALGAAEAAEHAALSGVALAEDDEEEARCLGAAAAAAHHRGDAGTAQARFRRAVELSAQAGGTLEEATYATGLAAASADAGDLAEALGASERAALLFEHLGRAASSARAALNRTAVFALAGARVEALSAGEDALARARRAGDKRCEAYVHLCLADALEGSSDALEHVLRADSLLQGDEAEPRLRTRARHLLAQDEADTEEGDAFASRNDVSTTARLEWWGSRAAAAIRGAAPESGRMALRRLEALANEPAPLATRGPALARGAALAARLNDGDAARRLALASSECARELLRRSGDALRESVAGLPWVAGARAPADAGVAREQVADVETLVRALGARERLRPLLDAALDALVLWTGVERGLLLLSAPGGRLVPRAARNLARADLVGEQLALSQSLARRALEAGEPVVAMDAAHDLPEAHASVHALKLRSVLALPLIARGDALGVVYLDDRQRRGAFGARELAWVRLVATIASVAIADARDQLLLRRAARRASRAEARTERLLARREAELEATREELASARGGRATRFSYEAIAGKSPALTTMLRVLDRVTTSDLPVLLEGESGSGKELVARSLHENGARSRHRFVAENCSAIPEGLVESTLFGHVRGAFTGATRSRTGIFEVADGGTLFLDEIGEMSLATQTKILRALEAGEITPVGASAPVRVDVRVIAATNRNLSAMVDAGTFRRDLAYRLDVLRVRVPPLRERTGDVAILARYFVAKHGDGKDVAFGDGTMETLERYEWPGNVRQLENEIRRALVFADDVVLPHHLSRDVLSGGTSSRTLDVRRRVDALERELLSRALEETSGNQTRAAKLLGMSRFGLQKMMKRLQITPAERSGGRARTQRLTEDE